MASPDGGALLESSLEKPHMWENKLDFYVTGPIGVRLLRSMRSLEDEYGDEIEASRSSTSLCIVPQDAPAVVSCRQQLLTQRKLQLKETRIATSQWRRVQHERLAEYRRGCCQARSEYDPPRRGMSKLCGCKSYDRVLLLPLTLFDHHEIAREFTEASRKLLVEAGGSELWPAVTPAADFLEQVEDSNVTAPSIAEKMRAHVFCYRLKPHRRKSMVEETFGDKTTETHYLRVDEYAVNCLLLPKLLHWCEAYGSAKKGLVLKGMLKSGPAPLPDRPRVLCRCGHGEAWHDLPSKPLQFAEQKLPDAKTTPSSVRPSSVPVETTTKGFGRTMGTKSSRELVLVGNRLVLNSDPITSPDYKPTLKPLLSF